METSVKEAVEKVYANITNGPREMLIEASDLHSKNKTIEYLWEDFRGDFNLFKNQKPLEYC